MKVIRNFRLGIDDNVNPEDIGSLIGVDHYGRDSARRLTVEMTTMVGKLAGITEHRGMFVAADLDDLEGLDGSAFPDFHTTLLFEDGRTLKIREWDSATITVYRED